jgi:hypothetical protein
MRCNTTSRFSAVYWITSMGKRWVGSHARSNVSCTSGSRASAMRGILPQASLTRRLLGRCEVRACAANLCDAACQKCHDSVESAFVLEEVRLCRRCMVRQYALVASVGRRSHPRSRGPWEIAVLAQGPSQEAAPIAMQAGLGRPVLAGLAYAPAARLRRRGDWYQRPLIKATMPSLRQ